MGHPMICPVKGCDTDFDAEIKCMSYSGGTVDSCGEANQNITIFADCPKCGFKVASDFTYDERWSNTLMEDANEDTHRQSHVPSKIVVAKWMTNEDADANEEEGE